MHRAQARALRGFFLCSALAGAAQPSLGTGAHTPLPGVVVEEATKGFEADKAGIQPGDILISWERAASPPANPASARGGFGSPFDVVEVEIDQAPRAKTLTLLGTRDGKKISVPILPFRWRLETRPRFSAKWLKRYEEGKRLVEGREIEKGSGIWRSLAGELSVTGSHVEAAWLWSRLGMAQSDRKQTDQAVVAIDDALAEARAAGRLDIEAQLWGRKSNLLQRAHRGGEAKKAARQALSIREGTVPESLAVADCLQDLAALMAYLDPEEEAIDRRAFRIREELAPDSPQAATSMNWLANIAQVHGDLRTAVDLHLRALAIDQRLDPRNRVVGTLLQNLCADEAERRDLSSADEYCRRSLELRRNLGPDDLGVAASLHNMAAVAQMRGDLDRAMQLQLQALAIRERIAPVSTDTGWNLFNLGVIEVDRGNLDKAEGYFHRAEEVQKVAAAADSPHEADTASHLAEIAYLRKDLDGAEKLLRQALGFYDRLAPNGPSAAATRDDLGSVLLERAVLSEAEDQFRRALVLREKFAPESQDTAKSRHHLGLLLWRTGHLSEAEVELRRAIDDLEAQGNKLGGSEESRSVFASEFDDYYKDYVDLLMQMRREQEAFLILERFRGSSLLRMMAQRDLAFSEDVPTGLERERRLTNAEYDRAQDEIRELNPKESVNEIDEGLARLQELRRKQTEIAERIKKASPRYAALQYPKPLDLAGTRATLDPGTVLLSYSIGKEKSYLFIVSGNVKLGPPLSVLRLPVGERALRESVEAFRRLIEWNKPSPELLSRSRSLYDTLLKPAEAMIGKNDRLLILPDGPLHTCPWAALVRDVKSGQPQYLVEWKPVHTAVSATVYSELKKSRPDGPRSPAIQVAAFGDPRYPTLVAQKTVVRRGDGTEGVEEEAHSDLQVSAVLRGGYKFEPLPRSRQEVEAIASLYAPKAEVYLGEQATEERAKAIGKDVPLIHYACHAYVNERFPLDSALVFTIPDKPREGQDNGLLQAWEIFEKVRIDADLVTLSACDSGLGKEMGGEGLIGLTRAFQYAGARSVLASLWKVEDASTGELMKRFYQYLKSGKTKDEALRLAQIDLIHSADFSQPKDWAAFQLNGDWK